MRRLLALFLALVLALGLLSGLSFAEEEKRTLSFVTDADRDWAFLFQTDIFKKLADELNCEFTFNAYNNDSFAAWLAGGELSDIVMCAQKINVVLESNLALNIDPYIDQYAPNLKDPRIASTMELSRQLQSPDGGLYLLMPNIGLLMYQYGAAGDMTRGYVVRWDYYKELGCPPISNDDEYIAVLQQMLANHPTNEDGTPNILYGVNPALAGMGGYRSAFKADVALNGWASFEYKNSVFTNEVIDGYLDDRSRYIDEMKFQNKIYRLGLWDDNEFSMPFSEVIANCTQGKYMGMYWAPAQFYQANLAEDPMTDKAYVSIPSSGTVQYYNNYKLMGQAPDYYSFIWKDSKNIDLALAFFNKMYDVNFLRECYSGEKGVTWDYDENGVPRMTAEAIAARASGIDPYWMRDYGAHGYTAHSLYGMTTATLHDDGYPLDLTLTKDVAVAAQTELQKDIAKAYGVDYYMEAYMNCSKDFRNDIGTSICSCLTVDADTRRIISACDEVLSYGMALLITAETDEEFDEIVAELRDEIKELGEEEVFAAYKAQWDSIKTIMQPLLLEALEANGLTPYTVE